MGLGGFGGPARRAPPTLLEGAGQAPPLTGCLRLFIISPAVNGKPFFFFLSLAACFSSVSLFRLLSTLAHQSRLPLRCASSPQALHLIRTITHF